MRGQAEAGREQKWISERQEWGQGEGSGKEAKEGAIISSIKTLSESLVGGGYIKIFKAGSLLSLPLL